MSSYAIGHPRGESNPPTRGVNRLHLQLQPHVRNLCLRRDLKGAHERVPGLGGPALYCSSLGQKAQIRCGPQCFRSTIPSVPLSSKLLGESETPSRRIACCLNGVKSAKQVFYVTVAVVVTRTRENLHSVPKILLENDEERRTFLPTQAVQFDLAISQPGDTGLWLDITSPGGKTRCQLRAGISGLAFFVQTSWGNQARRAQFSLDRLRAWR
jgi:hypothetical protein